MARGRICIIGGGLTGLAAAWELERRGQPYTLIEVKQRLGGAIASERIDGWIFDASAFVLEQYDDWPFLEPLGLSDALIPIGQYRTGRLVVFRDGTQMLVDALASRLVSGTVITRMAVSSVGPLAGSPGVYGLCLENGLLLTASAVICAVPARYAAHMLWALDPEIAALLDGYRYDPIVRVMLGFHKRDVPALTPNSDTWKGDLDLPALIPYASTYDLPFRVPPGGVLLRAGVRVPALNELTAPFEAHGAIAVVRAAFRPLIGAAEPVVARAYFWPEADPLTRYTIEHEAVMAAINARLPARVALIGSDYGVDRSARRIEGAFLQAEAAVEKVTG
ncbi:MAG: FAD-dependent oxidoreductase [Anaerolinea sp.]|nr:FAD-dependent oxidoreductase [Anaerolinea sp.]